MSKALIDVHDPAHPSPAYLVLQAVAKRWMGASAPLLVVRVVQLLELQGNTEVWHALTPGERILLDAAAAAAVDFAHGEHDRAARLG